MFIVREEEVGTRNENQRVEGEHDIVEGVSDLIVFEFGPTHGAVEVYPVLRSGGVSDGNDGETK